MRAGGVATLGLVGYLILGLFTAAFLLFLVAGMVGWAVGLAVAVWRTIKGDSAPGDHRGIEQDSAGLF
jgi:hypothetical protein